MRSATLVRAASSRAVHRTLSAECDSARRLYNGPHTYSAPGRFRPAEEKARSQREPRLVLSSFHYACHLDA
jgi:hypothetical protein